MARITVVVPVLNEEARLEGTLRSLRAQTVTDFELLVVDNGSTDGSREIAARFADRVVCEEEPGPDVARHRGFMEAHTEYLASADADSLYPPDWLAHGLRAVAQLGVVAAFGPMAWRESGPRRQRVEILATTALARLAPVIRVYPAGTASFACRRSAYLASGGLPPLAHLASADFRLAKVLRRFGRVVYCPGMACRTSNRVFAQLGPLRGAHHALRVWVDVALNSERVPSSHYLAICERMKAKGGRS